jgi:cysteine desulfurase
MVPIYLDHNATTPVDPEVLEAMLPFLREHFGNPSSGHAFGRTARAAIESARSEVASLIGAASEEIVFTSGGTEASQLALLGGAAALRRRKGGRALRLVSFALEHPATLRPLEALRAQGDTLVLIPSDPRGVVLREALLRAWDAPVRPDLVALMHAHNETGVVQPVEEVGRLCRANGTLFHVDAAQSLGKIAVDVRAIGCDLLSIAGHKLYGPKGTGALYVRQGVEIEARLPGAGQEHGRRGGTENVPGIVGLGAACRLAASRLAAGETARLSALRERLWEALHARVPGLARTGEGVARLPNTLHVRFPRATGNDVLAAAPEVAASTGSACHAGSDQPPAAILSLGVPEVEALGSVRLSVGHGTTPQAVDRAAEALARAWRTVAGGNAHDPGR